MALQVADDANYFDVKDGISIIERCNNITISATVNQYVRTYYTINVEEAMKKLAQVGELLQLSYSGSKGHPCSTSILELLSKYQDLVKESHLTSSTFVQVALKALSHHKIALMLADKNKGETALKFIAQCGELALQMANNCEVLIKSADELVKLSQNALLQCNTDQITTEEKQLAIIEKIKKFNAESKHMEQLRISLQNAVDEARKEEEKHNKTAEKNEKIATVLSVIIPVPPVSGIASESFRQNASLARTRADEAKSFRRELQQKERENNADLAKVVELLKSSVTDETELSKVIASLEITLTTLGKVKTIFSNIKQFWEGQNKHLKSLTDTDKAKALSDPDIFADFKDEFRKCIQESGFSWLSLGKINYQAKEAIRSVDEGVDKIMSNLPSRAESIRLIQDLSDKIIGDIKKENECALQE